MRRRGFWNGIITGGIIGALVGMVMSPQLKPGYQKKFLKTTRLAGKSARRMVKGVSGAVKDMMDL